MKRTVMAFLAGAVILPLAALDFDFTADPPTAGGKVPMLSLDDDALKIGGTWERTALNFDGKSLIQVPESSHLSLKNGLTAALDFDSKDKGDGKNLQMIIFKRDEWLFYRCGDRVDFMWKSGKKWLSAYRKNLAFDKPHKIVFTLDQSRKFSFWLDGKLIYSGKTASAEVPNSPGKELITLGGGWSGWGFKGDLYRIRILNRVWNKEQIQEFFK